MNGVSFSVSFMPIEGGTVSASDSFAYESGRHSFRNKINRGESPHFGGTWRHEGRSKSCAAELQNLEAVAPWSHDADEGTCSALEKMWQRGWTGNWKVVTEASVEQKEMEVVRQDSA